MEGCGRLIEIPSVEKRLESASSLKEREGRACERASECCRLPFPSPSLKSKQTDDRADQKASNGKMLQKRSRRCSVSVSVSESLDCDQHLQQIATNREPSISSQRENLDSVQLEIQYSTVHRVATCILAACRFVFNVGNLVQSLFCNQIGQGHFISVMLKIRCLCLQSTTPTILLNLSSLRLSVVGSDAQVCHPP